MKTFRLKLFLPLILALAAPAVYGDTVALASFSSTSNAGHGNFDIAGYQFNTSSAINVTSLGMWVSGQTLADTHNIGIFDITGSTLLMSGVVNAGAGKDGAGFTWVSLPGTNTLSAGDYFIGAQYNAGSSDFMWDGNFGSMNMASGLSFSAAAVYFSGGPENFSTPNAYGFFGSGSRAAFVGPNFTFTEASTPEPGTWGLLLAGVAGLAFKRRK